MAALIKSFKFNFRQQTYFFQFRIGFSLLCLFLFCLCCLLGIWQLHRYSHKKIMLDQFHQQMNASPVAFTGSNPQFQKVKLSGYYENHQTMLVQNRVYQNQLGFEVLTPLRIPGQKKLLLIDRGWIAATNQNIFSKLNPITEIQNISGYIKFLDEYQFILGKNILELNAKPLPLQRIDIKEISEAIHQEFYPFILRLDAGQSHGFIRDWTIATVTPERHMGYAIQWFGLATVLLIAYLCFCYERKEEKK